MEKALLDKIRERKHQERVGEEIELTGISGDPTVTEFTKIRVILKDKEFNIDLTKQLRIDENKLMDAMKTQAINFGFIATCCELAMAKKDRLEQELENTRAAVYFKLKGGDYKEKYEGKDTERALNNAVVLDEQVITAEENLREAKEQVGLLFAAKAAMEQRRTMLMSINANQRKELEQS
jgi:hypothetical protein